MKPILPFLFVLLSIPAAAAQSGGGVVIGE
jgi:hypothetical protein